MNFLSLEYFLTVAEERSFHSAARRLLLSDQSVSEAVKRLEEELDAPLFYRTRPLSLTPAGEVLQRGAKEILRVRRDVLDEIADNYASTRRDVLLLGITTVGAPSFLPELLMAFQRENPDCKVEVISFSNEAPDYPLRVNLFFLTTLPDDEMRPIHLKKDRLCMMVHEDLLKKYFGEGWQELCQKMEREGDPFLLRTLPQIQRHSNRADDVSSLVNNPLQEENVPKVITDNKEVNTALCLGGLGVLTFPEDNARRLLRERPDWQREKMHVFPLKGAENTFYLDLCVRKGRKPTRMEKAFIALAQRYFAGEHAE